MNAPPTMRVLLTDTVEAWTRLLGEERMKWRAEPFVLRNADVEGRGTCRPVGMRRRKAKKCFMNAARLTLESAAYDYVEGYAARDDIGFPFLHAWLIRKADGAIIDPTLADPWCYQYIGIRVTHEQLWAELARAGYYGLLESEVKGNREFMERYEAGRNRA